MLVENHIIDLLPDYSLNALEEDLTIQVAEHLLICEACRAELLAYQDILNDLPMALAPAEPPDSLKARLMHQIRPNPEATAVKERKSFFHRTANWFRDKSPAWGLASLAVVVILLVSNLVTWQRLNQPSQTESNALKVILMQGTDSAPAALGSIVLSTDGEYGTLVVDHLPALDPNLQYQLWLIQDGIRTSGGVFSVSDEGYSSLQISSPQPLGSYQGFGITIEPAGGSPQPTGAKVMGNQG